MLLYSIGVVLTLSLGYVNTDYDPFMDSDAFSIDWPGSSFTADLTPVPSDSELLQDENKMVLLTQNKERYQCILPQTDTDDRMDSEDAYTGPSEEELLEPLYKQTSCSYRIESFWTYELCHGRHLRQYHEEKEPGKKTKIQEYYLGKSKTHSVAKEDSEDATSTTDTTSTDTGTGVEEEKSTKRKKIPLQKVEGIEIPYYEVIFDDGTLCDLTGFPRRTALHYVCQPEGKGEVYELKETSTCEYEIVVLTSLLCSHPAYRLQKELVNKIKCFPLDGSPDRPQGLAALEEENQYGRYNKKEDDAKSVRNASGQQINQKTSHTYYQKRVPGGLGETTNKQMLKDFLSGEQCLRGGTGWWKHEFCYGKHIKQYHEDRDMRLEIILGVWDEDAHIAWINEKAQKGPKPKAERSRLHHYYGNGDLCEEIGKHRFTEVRLKCKAEAEKHGMVIYLTEPNTCEYTLVVESSLLCTVIQQAEDQYGLIKDTEL